MLRRITKAIEEQSEICEYEKVIKENCRLFEALLVLSKNGQLRMIFGGLKDHLVRKMHTAPTNKRKPTFLKHHRMLIDLMEAKEATRVEKLTRKLIFKLIWVHDRMRLNTRRMTKTFPK
jgi:DNA-binding FadR family transcriptional regulator